MAVTPQKKSGFENEQSRQSLKLNLEGMLKEGGPGSMYRESAPSLTGKGAPGIPMKRPAGEHQGCDYFGYGGGLTAVDTAGSPNIQNKGFICGKTAGDRKSDYEGGGATAAKKSVYRANVANERYSQSSSINGLSQGMRKGRMANESGQDEGNKA